MPNLRQRNVTGVGQKVLIPNYLQRSLLHDQFLRIVAAAHEAESEAVKHVVKGAAEVARKDVPKRGAPIKIHEERTVKLLKGTNEVEESQKVWNGLPIGIIDTETVENLSLTSQETK